MKKKGLLVFAATIMLATTSSAYATEEIDTWANLKTCLEGNETECVLKAGASITEEVTNVNVAINGTKTLDLNGGTITLTASSTADTSRFHVEEDDNLTITNGTIIKQGESTIVTVEKGGSLTVDATLTTQSNDNINSIGIWGSATDDGTKTNVTITKNGVVNGGVGVAGSRGGTNPNAAYGVTVTVKGKIAQPYASAALTINGRVKEGNPIINLENATVSSNGNEAIYAAGYGTWNITGGSFKGSEAIGVKSGIININGGTFEADGNFVAPESVKEESGKTTATGAAISITTNETYQGNVEITIKGNPTIKSKEGYALYEGPTGIEETAVNSIAIENGTFTAGTSVEGALSITSSEDEAFQHFISGGEFSSIVNSKFLSKGLVQEKGKDGNIIVKKPTTKTEKENNPATGDNLLTYVVMGTFAIVSVLGTTICLRKVNE